MTRVHKALWAFGLIVSCTMATSAWAQQPPAPKPAPGMGATRQPTPAPLQPVIKTLAPRADLLPPNAWEPIIAGLHAGKYGPPLPPLHGFVDLHAHPMSYLGFGGKLLYGAPDVLSTLPPGCNQGIAVSQMDALGHENDVYGLPGPLPPASQCGNGGRFAVIQALPLFLHSAPYPPITYGGSAPPGLNMSGPPTFATWPAWNDVLRQKMWVEWVRRAFKGGQRVMVALAVNSKLLGDVALAGNKSHDLPTDDQLSTDIQLTELKKFVARHPDFMAIAGSSTELYNIIASNRMAIVPGVEIDNIGNLVGNVPAAALNAEIDRLYAEGVRYIFPVHLVDNPIGKSAAYEDMFTVANFYEEHTLMHLSCESGINWHYDPTIASVTFLLKFGPQGLFIPPPAPCPAGMGNVNQGDRLPNGQPVGLSPAGQAAVQHMMDRGMLIDVDHMSEASVNDAVAIAQHNMPVEYPLFSGHNNLRGSGGTNTLKERELTAAQYARIGALHGMAGIGAANTTADGWLVSLSQTLDAMHLRGMPGAAFGTDADGMEFMMPPRQHSAVNPAVPLPAPAVALGPAIDGARQWDYNRDGVAHYGLLPDFLLDAESLPNGQDVVNQMFNGAQYFYESWFLAERDKKN